MIASANFLPMRLLVCLLMFHLSAGLKHSLFFVLFDHIYSLILPLAVMRVQSWFAGLRPCSVVVIALGRWDIVPFVWVHEYIACNGCSTGSALDKVSVLLSWAASTVDVLLTPGHTKQRAIVIFLLEIFSFVSG